MSYSYDLEKPGTIGVPNRIMRDNGDNLFKSHHKNRTRPENPGWRVNPVGAQTLQTTAWTLVDLQLGEQNSYLFTYNTFIKILYMFRALTCSSPGGLRRNCIYSVSQEKSARLWENVLNVEVHRYNPKLLYPKLNGYGDNGQRSLKVWQLLHTYWLPNSY
jgi:hypothetical protein